MKIAHIVCAFPPYPSGIGTAAYNFARLSASRGHQVAVFTPDYGSGSLEMPLGFAVNRLKPLLKLGNAAFLPGLYFDIKKFDLTYLHYPFFGGVEPVWLAKKWGSTGPRLFIHYHMDTDELPFPKNLFSWPGKLIRDSLFDRAERIICSSFEYIESSGISSYFRKNKKKFRELPFGVDTKKFQPKPDTNKIKKILFVGGLDKAHNFKGLNILIDAIGQLAAPAELVIVGDGDLRAKYEKQALESGLSERAKFVGRASDLDLVRYYENADVFVLPSLNRHEAFGIVLLEAMAAGVPVIASALPGVRTVFEDGVQGFLVTPGDSRCLADKLDNLLADDDKRRAMGLAARRLVLEKYEWEKIGDQLNSIYAGK